MSDDNKKFEGTEDRSGKCLICRFSMKLKKFHFMLAGQPVCDGCAVKGLNSHDYRRVTREEFKGHPAHRGFLGGTT